MAKVRRKIVRKRKKRATSKKRKVAGKAPERFPTQADRRAMRPDGGGKRARNGWPQ